MKMIMHEHPRRKRAKFALKICAQNLRRGIKPDFANKNMYAGIKRDCTQ
jgi:hypothetical protein